MNGCVKRDNGRYGDGGVESEVVAKGDGVMWLILIINGEGVTRESWLILILVINGEGVMRESWLVLGACESR